MGKAPRGGGKTGPNPTDRGKRGVKRSLLTDGRGVPLGAVIDGANRNDHKLMRQTLEAIPVGARSQPADGRSTYVSIRASTLRGAACLGRGIRLHASPAQPGRGSLGQASRRCQGAAWVVERTPLLAQPLPLRPDPLGQEAGQLSRPTPLRPRHHHLASRPTGIGS